MPRGSRGQSQAWAELLVLGSQVLESPTQSLTEAGLRSRHPSALPNLEAGGGPSQCSGVRVSRAQRPRVARRSGVGTQACGME